MFIKFTCSQIARRIRPVMLISIGWHHQSLAVLENAGNIGTYRVRAAKQLFLLGWVCLCFAADLPSNSVCNKPYAIIIINMHKAYTVQSILKQGVQIEAIAAYGE